MRVCGCPTHDAHRQREERERDRAYNENRKRDRAIPEALHSLQRIVARSADDDDDDDDVNDEDDDEVQRRRSRLLAVYIPGEQATRQPTRKALSAETT